MANYNFIYMGDTWITKSSQCSTLNYTGKFVFNDALVKAVLQNPRFILHGGDAVFSGDQPSLQYFINEKVKRIVPATTPFHVTPGNHDALFLTENGHTRISLANFQKIIGPLNFIIQAPDLKLVALNSIQIRRNNQGNDTFVYGLTNQQLNFLDRELKNTNVPFKLVSTHVPPEEWANTPEMNANKLKFMDILIKNKVSMVLLSHQHQFRDTTTNGIRFIISGGAGASLDTLGVNEIVLVTVRGKLLDAQVLPISWLDNRSFPPKGLAQTNSIQKSGNSRKQFAHPGPKILSSEVHAIHKS